MHIKLVNVRITNESPQASLRARYRVRPESMGFGQSGAKSGAKVWVKVWTEGVDYDVPDPTLINARYSPARARYLCNLQRPIHYVRCHLECANNYLKHLM